MSAWPIEKFSIETEQSRDEIIELLRSNTQHCKLFPTVFFSYHGKSFNGYVQKDHFMIASNIPQKNPFRAVLRGKIVGSLYGSMIHVSMHLSIMTSAFLIMFLVFCLMLSMSSLVNGFNNTIGIDFVIPILLFGIVFGFCRLLFRQEARESKQKLLKMLGITKRAL